MTSPEDQQLEWLRQPLQPGEGSFLLDLDESADLTEEDLSNLHNFALSIASRCGGSGGNDALLKSVQTIMDSPDRCKAKGKLIQAKLVGLSIPPEGAV